MFAIFIGTRERGAIYAACILGTGLSAAFAIPFWSCRLLRLTVRTWCTLLIAVAGRTSSLKGTTGTAFAFGLQSGIGQLGGVIGPQIFRSQYASDGYKIPYSICTAAIAAGFFGGCLCWYLTRNLERDVRRVKLNRIKAEREGRLYVGDDFDVYEERQFYSKGIRKVKGGTQAEMV